MANLPKIVPVSELRDTAASLLAEAQDSGQPIVITQRGRAAAVLLSVDVYERGAEQRELLLRLLVGEKELAAGRGRELEDVLAAAKKIVGS